MKYLRVKGVKEKTTWSPATIWAKSKDPNDAFPKPIKLSPKCTVWVAEEVDQYMVDRVSEIRGADNGG